jgi:hypothetical protein
MDFARNTEFRMMDGRMSGYEAAAIVLFFLGVILMAAPHAVNQIAKCMTIVHETVRKLRDDK